MAWPSVYAAQHMGLNNTQRGEEINWWAIWFWRLWSLWDTTAGSWNSVLFFVFHKINLLYPNNQWNKHQRHSDRCDSVVPYCISTLIRSQSQIITKTIMRSLAYRLHKMEPLLLFLPPVQGSRSIWRSGISLRSCSCCSIGVQQLPRRFPLSHELKAQHVQWLECMWRPSATLIQLNSN